MSFHRSGVVSYSSIFRLILWNLLFDLVGGVFPWKMTFPIGWAEDQVEVSEEWTIFPFPPSELDTGGYRPIFGLAVSPLSATPLVAVGSDPPSVAVLSAESGSFSHQLGPNGMGVQSLAFSPDGSSLAAGLFNGPVKVWSVFTSTLVTQLHGHKGAVRCVDFSENGDYLLSGGDDGVIKLWNIQREREVASFSENKAMIMDVSFLPGTSRFVSGGYDGYIRMWDTNDRHYRESLQVSKSRVNCLDLNKEGTALIVGCNDGQITLVSLVGSGMTIKQHSDLSPATWKWWRVRVPQCVEWLGNRGTVLVGLTNGEMLAWDIPAWRLVSIIPLHKSSISVIRSSPEEDQIWTGGWDGATKKLTLHK